MRVVIARSSFASANERRGNLIRVPTAMSFYVYILSNAANMTPYTDQGGTERTED